MLGPAWYVTGHANPRHGNVSRAERSWTASAGYDYQEKFPVAAGTTCARLHVPRPQELRATGTSTCCADRETAKYGPGSTPGLSTLTIQPAKGLPLRHSIGGPKLSQRSTGDKQPNTHDEPPDQ